ncbi:MAG TPA: hypothetical protein VGB60_11835 [Brevundimonas sp.]|jgi:hypothetical protein|uniref:hypothetical protein n=1 Tax=Brevundimonas sp. TaxID=1871086 RepID=UPI002ED8A1EC
MKKLFPPAAVAAFLTLSAGAASAEPAAVTVTFGPELQQKAEALGERDLAQQADHLTRAVTRTLDRRGALDGARIDLVLTDLKPNRPTFEQIARRPGLDPIRSISIGGAAIEGRITTADGQVIPVSYNWYSTSLADVHGSSTWSDAERAYRRLATNLAEGRYVRR